jgi:hypothetical protein
MVLAVLVTVAVTGLEVVASVASEKYLVSLYRYLPLPTGTSEVSVKPPGSCALKALPNLQDEHVLGTVAVAGGAEVVASVVVVVLGEGRACLSRNE